MGIDDENRLICNAVGGFVRHRQRFCTAVFDLVRLFNGGMFQRFINRVFFIVVQRKTKVLGRTFFKPNRSDGQLSAATVF